MSRPTVTTLSGEVLAVDLQTRDFEGFRNDALALADTVAPDWTDRSELDVGVTLVEDMAFMADNLAYYQDRVGNEALWPSARQRRSIIEQAKLIGYELRPNTSASVNLTFVANGAGLVPAGTTIDVDTSDGSDPATFELDEDFSPVGAGTFTNIVALAGRTVNETVGSSDGTPGQRFRLDQKPLALRPDGSSSLQVFVSEGGPSIEWTEVDNFLESGPTDEHFRVEITESDDVDIIFPDGVAGKIPASGTNNITANYRVGGGRDGNKVGPNKLTKLGGAFAFIDSVTNPAQPSGGMDKESIAEAKENAPQSLSAMDRAVTHQDYAVLARRVPGVSDSFAATGVGLYEEVVAIAAAGDNPTPSGTWDEFTETGTGLIGAVGAYLTARKTVPVILKVVPARAVEILLTLTVRLFDNVRRTTAQLAVDEAIREEYHPESFRLGNTVPISLVSDLVEDVRGVDYLTVTQHQRLPSANYVSGTPIGDPTFSNFVVGPDTLADIWTLEFLTPLKFKVTGQDRGLQVATGTLGSTYTTDDGGFSFDSAAGATPAVAGERYELRTTTFVSDIEMDPDEVGALHSSFAFTLVGGVA